MGLNGTRLFTVLYGGGILTNGIDAVSEKKGTKAEAEEIAGRTNPEILSKAKVSDLRNKFPDIEKNVNEGEPVYLTKNGYGSMVVLSLEMYSRLTDGVEKALDEADRAAESYCKRGKQFPAGGRWSGRRYEPTTPYRKTYSLNSSWEELKANPKTRAVLEKEWTSGRLRNDSKFIQCDQAG